MKGNREEQEEEEMKEGEMGEGGQGGGGQGINEVGKEMDEDGIAVWEEMKEGGGYVIGIERVNVSRVSGVRVEERTREKNMPR